MSEGTIEEGAVIRARDFLETARRITVLTGAGVSAESGVPTFRDEGGFWSRFPPEQFATWQALERLIRKTPLLAAEFVVELIRPILTARPNPAHQAIAELEHLKAEVEVITQNIDGLHQRAGSSRVIEVHGSIFEIVDEGHVLPKVSQITTEALSLTVNALQLLLDSQQCNQAQFLTAVRNIFGVGANGMYRPNIVLFGDNLPTVPWNQALRAAQTCDCMLIIGTSQLVFPAASIPEIARSKGAKLIAVGRERCLCDVWLNGSAGDVLPALISTICARRALQDRNIISCRR